MIDRITKKEIQKIKQTQGGQGRESINQQWAKKLLNTNSKKSKIKYIIKRATIIAYKTNITNSSNERIIKNNKKATKKKENKQFNN